MEETKSAEIDRLTSFNNDSTSKFNEVQFNAFYVSYNVYILDKNNTANNITVSDGDLIFKYLFHGILLTMFSVAGCIGNILSIIVCLHRKMRSSVSCLLIGLEICDTIILLSAIIIFGVPTVIAKEPWNPGTVDVYLSMGPVVVAVFPILACAVSGSVFFTLAVTIERYMIVCHPFLARRICTWKRACQASVGIYLFAIVYNLPRWFEIECITTNYDHTTFKHGCRLSPTTLRKHPVYNFNLLVVYFIVQYLIPIACLIVFNIIIYLKIRKANNSRKNLSVSEIKENSLAYMLVVVVVVFVMCNSMFGVSSLYILANWGEPWPVVPSALFVGTFLIAFNSSVNFLVYCIYGEKFRDVFLDILVHPWRRLSNLRQRVDSVISQGSFPRSNSQTQETHKSCDSEMKA